MSLYKTILVPMEGTPTDRAIIEHIKPLAKTMRSRVVLLHVASGVPAKYHRTDAAGKEIEESKAWLEQVRAELNAAGIPASAELAYGEPAREIVKWVKRKGCDLVAMSTHGHQFMADLVLGTTAIRVQHSLSVPVLMLRAR
ncbi:MAG TPA: universal stress protein [Verrucomicrobiota bacterium]|jgi:nucleotide-binding universal stress UspA family protein|nr:universal stress protein [Verrucomicrobiota bacterium]OQC25355.1 MAG: universal stress protein UspC [Verrucomicrobia bacterium ADurb.Bin063]HRR63331.1 universal stress protein [Candidatus Paceibacterota bacterium]MBP8015584.1 universal stress protein [Verrucomicrobiota bacterium]MDI9372331.1 universal stress protein [Verrucomicrobiota bacterium]